MESRRIIQVEEKVPFNLLVPLSIQHMFAMFGASVLVPFLFGISPAIVLFMNGVGTLLFIAITKGKAPAYLGSSFAFLAPAGIVISKMGYEYALGGFVAVGFCGCVLALIIYKFGSDWIDIVLPPAAMGPVVALIGLELSGNAAGNAGLLGDRISGDFRRGYFWQYCIPWIFIRYTDFDCGHCRICGCFGLRYREFCGNCRGTLVCRTKFSDAEVQRRGNHYDFARHSCNCVGTHRPSGCYKQNCRTGFAEGPGAASVPFGR